MNGDQLGPALCPVCRARFRGMVTCSRCGADLTTLLLLAARAYHLRQQAQQALLAGDQSRALACADEAQRLHTTPQGSLLRWVVTVLRADCAASNTER